MVTWAHLPATAGTSVAAVAPEARLGAYPENAYYFLGFNTREGKPFADPQVRAALAAAVDIPALVREATGNVGRPISSGAAPGSWADFTPSPTSTVDLERAQSLLDAAG